MYSVQCTRYTLYLYVYITWYNVHCTLYKRYDTIQYVIEVARKNQPKYVLHAATKNETAVSIPVVVTENMSENVVTHSYKQTYSYTNKLLHIHNRKQASRNDKQHFTVNTNACTHSVGPSMLPRTVAKKTIRLGKLLRSIKKFDVRAPLIAKSHDG